MSLSRASAPILSLRPLRALCPAQLLPASASACAAALTRHNPMWASVGAARGLRTKPTRLFETPRLRTVRTWHEFAPYVASISFRFDPAMTGTRVLKCVNGGAAWADRLRLALTRASAGVQRCGVCRAR